MISEIRNAFSKGSVVLSKRGIEVFYTYKGQWFSQSVENIRVFGKMLKSCDRFGIDVRAGKFIRMVFENIDEGRDVVFYTPITQEVSIEELQSILESESPSEEFVDFFMGVDIDDEEALRSRFLEWLEEFYPDEESPIVSFDGLRRWRKMCSLASKIASTIGAEINEDEEFIEFFYPESPGIRWFSGEIKEELRNLINLCSVVGIDGNVDDGILNITFFV